MDDGEINKLADDIFYSHLRNRENELVGNNSRFAHYTTVSGALSIISDKKIWLRNTSCMNDYSEVQHGIHLMKKNFGERANEENLWVLLSQINESLAREVAEIFGSWEHDLMTNTYITCVCEHDKKLDEFGKLSMWRGYGAETGVAFVINPESLFQEHQDAIYATTYPTHYFTEQEVRALFLAVEKKVKNNLEILKNLDEKRLISWVFDLLESLAIGLKHPVFGEEKEWRLVHRPMSIGARKDVKHKFICLNGVAQKVYELPLENISNNSKACFDLNTIIDHIIIGPTDQKQVMQEAFVEALNEAGVKNSQEKVICSNIPLRG